MNGLVIKWSILFGCILCVLSCGRSNKKTERVLSLSSSVNQQINQQSLAPQDIWAHYIQSNPQESRSFVDPRFFAAIFGGLPPKSDLVRSLKVDSTNIYGSHAKLNVSISLAGETFVNWLSFTKNRYGAWQLTLDETPILNQMTTNWETTAFKNIRYHTSQKFPLDWATGANLFNDTYDNFSKIFGYSPGIVDYYIARDPAEADLVVGEKRRGSGQARYRAIKAFDTPAHRHELVHVFAFEIGAINPFFDEGLATLLGDANLIESKAVCDDVRSLLLDGVETYLNATRFRTAQRADRKVYALAQQTLSYWSDEFGFDTIKSALKSGTENPFSVAQVLSEKFGSFQKTNENVGRRVEIFCRKFDE